MTLPPESYLVVDEPSTVLIVGTTIPEATFRPGDFVENVKEPYRKKHRIQDLPEDFLSVTRHKRFDIRISKG